jgi:peptidoglycan biosynthesis protein MviN/MurJ (putative lipid II flippase)
VANVALCAALVAPFGIRGLAAAASLAAIAEFLLLLRTLQVRLGGLDGRALRRSVTHTVVATIVMAEAVVLLLVLLKAAGVDDASVGGALLLSAAGGSGGLAAFALASMLLHSEEYRGLMRRLRP